MADSVTIESCVCGYHYYQDVWAPVIGEELECEQEPGNVYDRYAVAGGIVIGHVPRRISVLCYLFLRKGERIISRIIGNRRYSYDLAQGGWMYNVHYILSNSKKCSS